MTALSLINLEAQSARVAAQLDARPELGALWRRLVAVSEASANLSMEDIPVPEQDILLPDMDSAMVTGDPQSARIAGDIHTFLLRPGRLLEDPLDVFDRARTAGYLTSIVDEDKGGRVARLSFEEEVAWSAARNDFEILIRKILRSDAPILFKLIAFSGVLTQILPERVPITERLIFMAAESALRHEESLSDRMIGFKTREKDFRISAHWTLTPALALSRSGFRAWSPASDSGTDELAKRLMRALKFNVGRLGQLHSWMLKLQDFKGKHGKSRRQDLAKLVLSCPIMSADIAADRLGMHPRSVRGLIDEAVSEGLLGLMTQRRNYRLFAVPALAEMMRERPALKKPKKITVAPNPEAENQHAMRGHNRPENEEAMISAAEELDRAMAKADAILAKYRRDTPTI
jgi:hypothetical protein